MEFEHKEKYNKVMEELTDIQKLEEEFDEFYSENGYHNFEERMFNLFDKYLNLTDINTLDDLFLLNRYYKLMELVLDYEFNGVEVYVKKRTKDYYLVYFCLGIYPEWSCGTSSIYENTYFKLNNKEEYDRLMKSKIYFYDGERDNLLLS